MKYSHLIVTLLLVSVTSNSALAQEDSWWKKLFKKETVDEIDQKTEQPVESQDTDTLDSITPMEEKDTLVQWTPSGETGHINIQTPGALDKLVAQRKEEPLPNKGFRIQIFYGSLADAKSERTQFMSDHSDLQCYLINNKPNFAVRVGNFRSELDAYRVLHGMKSQYPFAYVVPDQIEFPDLNK